MKHEPEAADVIARIIAVVGVWLGSITLGEVVDFYADAEESKADFVRPAVAKTIL